MLPLVFISPATSFSSSTLPICMHAGCTLLTAAVACGNVPGLQLLLAHGASPSVQDSVGNTPLSIAAALGLCDAVKALLCSGANPDACAGKQKEFPLQIALHLWHASAQQAQLRHAPSFDEAADSGCLTAMPVMSDIVGNAVARNALALMEEEGAESTELGEQEVSVQSLVRSEVMHALAKDADREEKMEREREKLEGMMEGRGEGAWGDGVAMHGMGADAIVRLRRAVADFWGSTSGSLAGTDEEREDEESEDEDEGALGKISDESGSDESFHDSCALPGGEENHEPGMPFMTEDGIEDMKRSGGLPGEQVEGKESVGEGIMAAAVESSLMGLDEDVFPGVTNLPNGVTLSPADVAAAADRGDKFLHAPARPPVDMLPGPQSPDISFPGSLSSFSNLSNCSVDRDFQGGSRRHIFCATNMPDEVRFSGNSAGLATVSAQDAVQSDQLNVSHQSTLSNHSAGGKASKRTRSERARVALETPLSAVSAGFLVPLSSPYRPLQRPLGAHYRTLTPGVPNDLDLCHADARSNSLPGWNSNSYPFAEAKESQRSRFPGSRRFRGSGRLFKRVTQPAGATTRGLDQGGDEAEGLGCTPWLQSKMQRSQSGETDRARYHSSALSCLRGSNTTGSPLAGATAEPRREHAAGGDGDAVRNSMNSPGAGCVHWPQSMSMSRSGRAMHVGQRDSAAHSAIPIGSDQPKPCCAPSVGALWTYVTQFWVDEEVTEGLRTGDKGVHFHAANVF